MLPAERHGEVLGIDVNTPLLGGSAKVSLRKSAHLCKEFQKMRVETESRESLKQ